VSWGLVIHVQVPIALWPRAHMYVHVYTLWCLGAHGLAYYTTASFPGFSQAFWLRIIYMYIVNDAYENMSLQVVVVL